MKERDVDEIIEIMWLLKEENKPATDESIRVRAMAHHFCVDGFEMPSSISRSARSGIALGLLKADGEVYTLTEKGETHARGIIRRHRLAEKLFYEVLEVPREQSEAAACDFEHILGDDVVDRVCAFLGHPEVCPHGKKIPRGKCCAKLSETVETGVFPLISAEISSKVVVSFISSKKPEVVRKLTTFGIMPGSTITLIQKGTAIVLGVGENTIAIDKSIAEFIYVKAAK